MKLLFSLLFIGLVFYQLVDSSESTSTKQPKPTCPTIKCKEGFVCKNSKCIKLNKRHRFKHPVTKSSAPKPPANKSPVTQTSGSHKPLATKPPAPQPSIPHQSSVTKPPGTQSSATKPLTAQPSVSHLPPVTKPSAPKSSIPHQAPITKSPATSNQNKSCPLVSCKEGYKCVEPGKCVEINVSSSATAYHQSKP